MLNTLAEENLRRFTEHIVSNHFGIKNTSLLPPCRKNPVLLEGIVSN